MTIYTRLERDEIDRLSARFPIGVLEDIKYIAAGQANSSFKLTTSTGIYVLSVCDEKAFGEVKRLARLLRHLAENGFRTTRVVRAKDGAMVIDYLGKPVLLKHYVAGSVPQNMTAAMARQVGRELARLHQVIPPPGLPPSFAYGLASYGEVIASRSDDHYREWLREKKAYLTQAISPDLPRCLIHGDVFYDNTLFNGQKLAAIIDFEEACHYYRTFDLGMCAAGFCTTGGLLDINKTRGLMDGYLASGNLSSREKKALQAFVIYGATATSFWRFRQYNLRRPGHENSKTYRQMNRIADQVHQMPVDDFFKAIFA
jgi:homoserine kinase type II